MPNPPIIAHHLIWTAYGWWLPNDPRGSMSHTIACDIIAELGELHYGRKLIQPTSREVKAFYAKARDLLRFPLLEFTDAEIADLGNAMGDCMAATGYTCYACALMLDHVHVLVRRHKHRHDEIASQLQTATRIAMQTLHADRWRGPDEDQAHPIWGGPGWTVFLDSPHDIRRTIRYIENNPAKLRRPPRRWPFVMEYDNWPLHKSRG